MPRKTRKLIDVSNAAITTMIWNNPISNIPEVGSSHLKKCIDPQNRTRVIGIAHVSGIALTQDLIWLSKPEIHRRKDLILFFMSDSVRKYEVDQCFYFD